MSFVYIFERAGLYKIGFSGNTRTRLNNLRVLLGKVSLVYAIPTDAPGKLEKHLHSRFSDKRTNSDRFIIRDNSHKLVEGYTEWFKLSVSDVDDIKNEWPVGLCPDTINKKKRSRRKKSRVDLK